MSSSFKQWLGALGLTIAGVAAIAANSPAEVPVTPVAVPAVTQEAAPQPAVQQKSDEPKTSALEKLFVSEPVVAPTPVSAPVPAVKAATPTPTPTPKSAPVPTALNGTYTNTAGNEVPSPYYAPSAPAGASARCRDGTYSFSQSRRGTCSHHGGVAEWL